MVPNFDPSVVTRDEGPAPNPLLPFSRGAIREFLEGVRVERDDIGTLDAQRSRNVDDPVLLLCSALRGAALNGWAERLDYESARFRDAFNSWAGGHAVAADDTDLARCWVLLLARATVLEESASDATGDLALLPMAAAPTPALSSVLRCMPLDPISTSPGFVKNPSSLTICTGDGRTASTPVAWAQKQFQILEMLIDREGDYVTAEELRRKCASDDVGTVQTMVSRIKKHFFERLAEQNPLWDAVSISAKRQTGYSLRIQSSPA